MIKTIQKHVTSEEIINYFKNKDIDENWSFKEYKRKETSKLTHGYHRYPAKFIPQLVEKLFDEYVSGEDVKVNDPFMGSGTTIVSAISRGYYVSGTDINKIAYLITKVKSTPINPDYLKKKLSEFFIEISDLNVYNKVTLFDHEDITPLIPQNHIERIDYWFHNDIKLILGKLLRIIMNENDNNIRDFLIVAFSNILKNCSIWLQNSTKPTRDFNKIPSDPIKSIIRQLKKMQVNNSIFYNLCPVEIKNNIKKYLNIKVGEAEKQPVESSTIDLIVTSSPYVTSYEYADLHQLSTIWLDLVDDLKEYKSKFIGSSYKNSNLEELKSHIAIKIVEEMQLISKKFANEIEAFFIDMQEVIKESYRILKSGGRACYVIGNTKLKGVSILNAEVFTEIMSSESFEIERIIKREIPSKILPQTRDLKTGRFAKSISSDNLAYPTEYIIVGKKGEE